MDAILNISQSLQKFSASQGGVFSIAELKNLINPSNKAILYRTLKRLEEAAILRLFCRGFYVTNDFDIQVLSQRICADSYISFGTVLANNLIIGSMPKYRIQAVKKGQSRVYQNSEYRIEHFKVKPELFTGYENVNGVKIATPEKAFLDVLYYYQKGMNFSFDIYSDIDYDALDRQKIEQCLILYKNKKFVAFVNGVLNA
jgi:predicted transcriptional regulator of viral defense system